MLGLRKNRRALTITAGAMLLGMAATTSLPSKDDRDTVVRRDRDAMGASDLWLYNNLEAGLTAAEQSGKPVAVVFR